VARTGRQATTGDLIRSLALILIPLVVITVLFTRQYLASVPVFQLWTCTLVLAVPCVDAVLRARAQTRFLLVLNVLRLAMVIGLIGWCLRAFGLPGAALAMLAARRPRAIAIGRIARVLGARASRVAVAGAGGDRGVRWHGGARRLVYAAARAPLLALLCAGAIYAAVTDAVPPSGRERPGGADRASAAERSALNWAPNAFRDFHIMRHCGNHSLGRRAGRETEHAPCAAP
jgi:hypothetical protein